MGTINCIRKNYCLLGMALLYTVSHCAQEQPIAQQLAPLCIATRAHKRAHESIIADVVRYAQQNDRYTPALRQIHNCLNGTDTITDPASIPDGVHEFATLMARVRQIPEAKCCTVFDKELHRMAPCTRNSNEVSDGQAVPLLEDALNDAIYTAMSTITRGGSNSLVAGDGAGNNIFIVTTEADLTCSRDGAQAIDIASTGTGAKTVAIGSTNTTSSMALNAGSGNININVANGTNAATNINTTSGSGAVAIGNTTTTTTTIKGATTAIGEAATAVNITGTTGITGATTINSTGAFAVNINTVDSTGAVHIADGTGANSVGIGNTNTTATTIKGATTAIGEAATAVNITGTTGITGATTINSTGAFAVNINTVDSTGAVHIADGTGANSVGIGNTNTTAVTVLGATTINTTGSNATTLGSATSTTTVGGLLKNSSGTYAAPSVTFTSDTTTGSYYYADTTRKADTAFEVQATAPTLTQGPDVTFLASGKFATVYVDSTPHVYLKVGAADYSLGAATQVDVSHAPNVDSGATVAYDVAHDYIVVAWIDGTGGNIWFRRFSYASGTIAAIDVADVRVNTAVDVNVAPTTGFWPSIVVGSDGTIVIFWAHLNVSYEIYARRTSTAGAVQGSDVLVNTATLAIHAQRAAYLGGSRAIVCWTSGTPDLYYNVFDLADGSVGTPTQANTTALHATDLEGCVSAIENGNVLFTYKASDTFLYEKIFDNALSVTPIKAETAVTAVAVGSQSASAGDGTSFVIGWTIASHHLNVQNYTAAGTVIGSVVDALASGTSCGTASRPALALCGGNCIAAWYNYGAVASDAVNAQAFSLRGLGTSALGARSARFTKDTDNLCTTDIYGTLNVTGGDIRTTGNLYVSGGQSTGDLIVNGNLIVKDGAGTAVFSVAQSTGNVCTKGSVSSTQSNCSVSDRRIKTEVVTLNQDQCLSKVNQLRPVSYCFTPEWLSRVKAPTTRQVGLIAQEVEEIAPEVTGRSDFGAIDEIHTISYERLVPYLICSIQLLSKKIELLEASGNRPS